MSVKRLSTKNEVSTVKILDVAKQISNCNSFLYISVFFNL